MGLIVDKIKDYIVKSNRESGYGRYDVVMEPKDINNPAENILKYGFAFEGEECLIQKGRLVLDLIKSDNHITITAIIDKTGFSDQLLQEL